MAAGLPAARAVFVHGYLLMDGEKMTKSLGNVLDPFEVIERFGTDALRFYCCATSRSARTALSRRGLRAALRDRARQRARQPCQPHDRHGRPLPRRRGARSTWTRRSRDSPGWRARRRAARPRRAHPGARGDLGAGAAPEPLRRGAGAVAAGQGPRARRRARPALAHADRGRACPRRAAPPFIPETVAKLRRRSVPTGPWAPRSARGVAARRELSRSFRGRREPTAARDRLTHAPRPCAAADAELVAAATAAGRRCRMLTVGTTPNCRVGASWRPRPTRRSTPRSATIPTPRRASTSGPRRPPELAAPRCPRDRRDGPGLLPRPCAAADQERAFPAQIDLPAPRQAAGHPHPRRRGRHPRDAGRRDPGDSRSSCTASPCPSASPSAPTPRWWFSFAGNVTYPKALRAGRGGRARSRSSGCSWRPTRPTSPPAGAQAAQPPGVRRAHRALRRAAARPLLRGARVRPCRLNSARLLAW